MIGYGATSVQDSIALTVSQEDSGGFAWELGCELDFKEKEKNSAISGSGSVGLGRGSSALCGDGWGHPPASWHLNVPHWLQDTKQKVPGAPVALTAPRHEVSLWDALGFGMLRTPVKQQEQPAMLVPQSSIPMTRLLVKANPSQHPKNSSTQKSTMLTKSLNRLFPGQSSFPEENRPRERGLGATLGGGN